MVRESVESYDLAIRIRTFARISVRAGVAIAGEGAVSVTRRQTLITADRAAAYDLRTRGIDAIDEAIRVARRGYPGRRGAVLASRLKAVRAKFSVDPFVSITRSPNLFEPAYFDQTRLAKKNFWLNRFEVDAVGWFWELCGLIDIRETLLGELSVYCREEFAFVCDAMWQCIIGINVERAHLAQHGNVHTRTMEALTVTQIDRAN
jgi:hypothetical protein